VPGGAKPDPNPLYGGEGLSLRKCVLDCTQGDVQLCLIEGVNS
jgi:hypothetical protein